MYLLDFAGTLFDLASFEMYARPSDGPYAPGELSRFLYPDARSFLMEKGNSAMIVTAADKVADANFMQSALEGIPRIAVMYTNGVLKGDFLAPYIGMYGASPIFVDDSVSHLESMAEQCPQVRLYEMRRDGGAGDGRWPVIHALAELPSV